MFLVAQRFTFGGPIFIQPLGKVDDQLCNIRCSEHFADVVDPFRVFFRRLITNLELILHRAVGNHDRLLVVF